MPGQSSRICTFRSASVHINAGPGLLYTGDHADMFLLCRLHLISFTKAVLEPAEDIPLAIRFFLVTIDTVDDDEEPPQSLPPTGIHRLRWSVLGCSCESAS